MSLAPERPSVSKLDTPAAERAAGALATALILLASAALAAYGITRSLWLDEAWVANSVLERTWSGMFYYPDWLQTSPPLFLALERMAVAALGSSNAAFRLYPAAAALAAVAVFLLAARRALTPAIAILACAALAFQPTVLEYARTLKQYSGEIAASAALLLAATAYLQDPSRRRFRNLVATVAIALPLAYSSVFLIPGLVAAVYVADRDRRAAIRASILAGVAAAILAVLYIAFIRPNYSPVLRGFWSVDASARNNNSALIAAVILCVAAAMRAAWKIRATTDWRVPLELVCALPCLLLAASAAMGWYPASPRTRLFALPCFLLLAGLLFEELASRYLRGRVWRIAAALSLALACASAVVTVRSQIREHRNIAEEDMAAALAYIDRHASPEDLRLVHASLKEDFKLYAAGPPESGEPTTARPAIFGATGWPCCVRGHLAAPHSSSADAVIADLEAKVPRDFHGRIWLLYSTRPTQWDYTGLDEGNLWRSYIWSRGCPPENISLPKTSP